MLLSLYIQNTEAFVCHAAILQHLTIYAIRKQPIHHRPCLHINIILLFPQPNASLQCLSLTIPTAMQAKLHSIYTNAPSNPSTNAYSPPVRLLLLSSSSSSTSLNLVG